jgi:hypothetical protein
MDVKASTWTTVRLPCSVEKVSAAKAELESPAIRRKAETSAEQRSWSQAITPQGENIGLPHGVLQFGSLQRLPISTAYLQVPSRIEFNKIME